jgi:hypothetical protein
MLRYQYTTAVGAYTGIGNFFNSSDWLTLFAWSSAQDAGEKMFAVFLESLGSSLPYRTAQTSGTSPAPIIIYAGDELPSGTPRVTDVPSITARTESVPSATLTSATQQPAEQGMSRTTFGLITAGVVIVIAIIIIVIVCIVRSRNPRRAARRGRDTLDEYPDAKPSV